MNELAIEHLGDIKRMIESMTLPYRVGPQLCYALNSFSNIVGVSLDHIPASVEAVHTLATNADWQSKGKSAGTWANVRSKTFKCLRLCGRDTSVSCRNRTTCVEDTAALIRRIPVRKLRNRLGSLIGWCAAHDIDLRAFSQADADSYYVDMLIVQRYGNAHEVAIRALRTWEQVQIAYDFWPRTAIRRPSKHDRYSFLRSLFSEGFRDDVDAMVAVFRDPPGGRASGRRRLSASYLKRRAYLMFRAASIVARKRNVVPESFQGLNEIITTAALDDALDFLMQERGKPERCADHDQLVLAFVEVGRHFLRLDETVLTNIENFHQSTKFADGPSPRTIELLRKFRDPDLQTRFTCIPDLLKASTGSDHGRSPCPRVRAEAAVAIAILRSAPMRSCNLAALTDQNFETCSNGDVVIKLAAEDVKNDRAERYILSLQAIELLQWYRLAYNRQTGPLFRGRGVTTKRPANLSKQLALAVGYALADDTIRVTAHQFRALIGYFWLQRHPGDYESVRRMLGHRLLETTLNFYAFMLLDNAQRDSNGDIERTRRDAANKDQQP